MPVKKPISTAERRHQDYLRRKTLKVGAVYEGRLIKARRKELRRVLGLARDLASPDDLPGLLEGSLTEASYLPEWWTGLWTTAGVPQAQSVARTLRQAKAAGEEDVWLATLRRYATARAGNEIVSVTGTWKDSLVGLVRNELEKDPTIGIEKLTKQIYGKYTGGLEKWQCRRIAQTESMIGMAEAGDLAAKTLDVAYTKQWCISGLGNTRASHEAMDGVTVDEDEPFELAGGMMMYPHDPSMGADAGEIINCACCCIRRPKTGTASQQAQTAEQGQEATPPQTEEEIREERIKELMKDYPEEWSDEDKRANAESDLGLEKAWGIKKGKPMNIEDADKQSANPNWDKGKAWHVNCATCAPAYKYRRDGFNVWAKGNTKVAGSLNYKASREPWGMWQNLDGTQAKPATFADWMAKNKYKKMTAKRYEAFLAENCKKEGIYELVLNWKGGGGHATILERLKDGKLVRIEPQKYYEGLGVQRSVDDLVASMRTTPDLRCGVMRLNDKKLDPKWAGLFNSK